MGWLQNFYHIAINQLELFKITDIIDIIIVSYIVYKSLKFIRDTRTIQLLKGVALVVIATQVAYFAKLNTLHFILSHCLQLGIIALLIVFQPELRRALEHAGRTFSAGLFSQHEESGAETQQVIRELAKAAQALSNTRTGALMIIERKDNTDSLISSGVDISAKVSCELLENIFVPDTPLHDGAVIIRNCRIERASCVLPLSQNPNIKTSYGTRHRAGIGITEESDVIAVIVSEETGRISVANNGVLSTGYNEDTLRARILELIGDGNSADPKAKFKLSNLSKRRRS